MAFRGLGTTITKGGVLIGGLTDINGIAKTADTIDSTTLDSSGGYRNFVAGFKDGGEVGLTGYFDPNNTGQIAMETAFESGSEDVFVITFPNTVATWTFSGVVTALSTTTNVDGLVTYEATIKTSGAPTLGTTASTGASDIQILASDGATALVGYDITPAFATDTYLYNAIYNTDTAFTVTVTATNHTIKLYIDDVLQETLTSGTASAVYAQSADTAKKLTIIVYEENKTPKTYTIMLARTA